MGELHYFLGVSVKQASETGRTWIGQPGYTEAMLKKFGVENCKPANTPIVSWTKLLKATDDSERMDTNLYQSAVGCLLYLSGWTRPDVAYAILDTLGLGFNNSITSVAPTAPSETNSGFISSGKCEIIVFNPRASSPQANASR